MYIGNGYGFSSSHVWMWDLDYKESWVPKNWCFWSVVLEKTLKSPLDCREIKPVNPKEINPEYSLEGLMWKLKLQYFGHLTWRVDSLEKTLILGKTESKRRREWQRMRWLDVITDSRDMSLSKLWEIVKDREAWIVEDREAWLAAIHGLTKSWTWPSDWTTTITGIICLTLKFENVRMNGEIIAKCSQADFSHLK